MKIKRYIVNNNAEAMLKVKAELGMNAIILHSRKIKKPGILGFIKKPLIEVVAAVEDNTEAERKILDGKNNTEYKPNIKESDNLQEKLDSIQSLLLKMATQNNMNQNNMNDVKNESPLFNKYYNVLLENDLDKNVALKILNIAQKQISFTNDNEEAVRKAIKLIIKEYLGVARGITKGENNQQKIVVFVGPTGVGKTTTLAKLAAKLAITNSYSVGLITADTYRIAAVEQLRTYSEILDISLKVIYEPEEINNVLQEYKNKDIVLIDTAGRNHRLEDQLDEIKKLIGLIPSPEVFLVISAATGYKDIQKIVHSYSFIEDYKLIFTKLDESVSVGNIINAKILTGKDLSYFTTGQSVPEDIEIANSDKITDRIVGDLYE